ncbi:MAG: 30S ribosomal protein S6 [candidate division WOR-3 bacterium]|nr:MAG: 30S ribosomal protein S6 [candidate division WOR-3 bacterium]
MREYEAMFIFHPELPDDKLEQSVQAVEKIIESNTEGELKTEHLGKKTLAYAIKKVHEGYYVNYCFHAPAKAIDKIHAGLKHSDDILRYIIFVKDAKK